MILLDRIFRDLGKLGVKKVIDILYSVYLNSYCKGRNIE